MRFIKPINEYVLYYNNNFIKHLQSIKDETGDEISSDLLSLCRQDNKDIDINYISTGEVGQLNYVPDSKISRKIKDESSDRVEEEIERILNSDYDRRWIAKQIPVSSARIGRTVQKVLKLLKYDYLKGEYSASDIETFVNRFIARQKISIGVDFEILEGDDIIKGYRSDNYAKGDYDSELFDSCMVDCNLKYFDIYVKNHNCKLLTLKNEEGKITGRCLLWDATLEDKEYKIMDRVYTIRPDEVEIFRSWAQKSGYYYRMKNTNADNNARWKMMSPDGVETELKGLEVKLDTIDYKKFPYLDTFKFLNRRNYIICNSSKKLEEKYNNKYLTLDDTGGSFSGDDNIVVDYKGELIDKDKAIFSDSEAYWMLEDESVPFKYFNGFRWYSDRILTNSDKIIFCDPLKEYYLKKQCVWSKYHNSFIPEKKSIEVKTEDEGKDYILEDYEDKFYKPGTFPDALKIKNK